MTHWIRTGFAIVSVLLFSACSPEPKAPEIPKVDPTLPVPQLTNAVSDMTQIALEWKKIDDRRVAGYSIYRGLNKGENGLLRSAFVTHGHATHFTDMKLEPGTTYSYRIAVRMENGTESTPSKMMTVTTRDFPPPVSYIATSQELPRMAKVIWRPHFDSRVGSYVIQRKEPDDKEWEEVTTLKGRLNAEYIDTGLSDGTVYQYRVVAVTLDGIKAYASKASDTTTKPLPPVVENVTASVNLPKKVALVWEAAVGKYGPYAYNVYASGREDGGFEKIADLNGTAYTETLEEDGEPRFYKVTAVDPDGLESPLAPAPAPGMSKAKPRTPEILSAQIKDGNAVITFQPGDARAVSYVVVRKRSEGFFKSSTKRFTDVTGTVFYDPDAAAGGEFTYRIIAVDNDGVESLPSEEVVLVAEKQEK